MVKINNSIKGHYANKPHTHEHAFKVENLPNNFKLVMFPE